MEKTNTYNANVKIITEDLEFTRKKLKITNYILWFNILGPVFFLRWIYPYGIHISLSALAIKLLIWGLFKRKWQRDYMEWNTKINWKRQGIDVNYEQNKGIDKEQLKKYDLVQGKIVKSCMSREKIYAELIDSYFEASDFMITYEKADNRITSRIPYIAGLWMTFSFKDQVFIDMKIKKKSLDTKNESAKEINKLLDEEYGNFGYDDLTDDKQDILKKYLLNYNGSIFIFTDQSKIHFIFDRKFINQTPDLSEEITEDLIREGSFSYFPQTYKLAQKISYIKD